ncbi:PH domain-containing protein [Devriesea agamarum]|uniref:PH domain-containing protein n=1 Tax=Devriesea agamarum TaxID=472569 RepID=UPI00071D1C33|nr:PH domain-containing protein [Devriesea agamarum]
MSSNANDTSVDSAIGQRLHPLTIAAAGWRLLAVFWAVAAYQGITKLISEFSVQRLLWILGVFAIGLILASGWSALTWWRTRYVIDQAGVRIHSGMLVRSTQSAPREKIEAVDVERPAVARVLGLAAVTIEVAGGIDSKLKLAYVKGSDADRIRRQIMQIARGDTNASVSVDNAQHEALANGDGGKTVATYGEQPAGLTGEPTHAEPGLGPVAPEGASAAAPSLGYADESESVDVAKAGGKGRLYSLLHDGVTEGQLIADIPSKRILHSIMRDISLVIGVVVTVAVAAAFGVHDVLSDGLSWWSIPVILGVLYAGPSMLFLRVESGWGFIARASAHGIRIRRGLFSTHNNNIIPERVQALQITQPFFWRGPDWYRVKASIAGYGIDTSERTVVLPVGTREEMLTMVKYLMCPLVPVSNDADEPVDADDSNGADEPSDVDDSNDADEPSDVDESNDADNPNDSDKTHLSAAHQSDEYLVRHLREDARDVCQVMPPRIERFFSPWGWRRHGISMTDSVLVIRSGVWHRRVTIVPRDRPQGIQLIQGPIAHRIGVVDLHVNIAGSGIIVVSEALPCQGVEPIVAQLAASARHGRRYGDQKSWQQPAIALPTDHVSEEGPAAQADG